ncbi:MAG: hypothetical protein WC222_08635 [Parachlamydiales bacterium]|jgi:hypothetical protein
MSIPEKISSSNSSIHTDASYNNATPNSCGKSAGRTFALNALKTLILADRIHAVTTSGCPTTNLCASENLIVAPGGNETLAQQIWVCINSESGEGVIQNVQKCCSDALPLVYQRFYEAAQQVNSTLNAPLMETTFAFAGNVQVGTRDFFISLSSMQYLPQQMLSNCTRLFECAENWPAVMTNVTQCFVNQDEEEEGAAALWGSVAIAAGLSALGLGIGWYSWRNRNKKKPASEENQQLIQVDIETE